MNYGQNLYDKPIKAKALFSIKDVANRGLMYTVEGRVYDIVGEYVGGSETFWMVNSLHGFFLLSKHKMEIIEDKEL